MINLFGSPQQPGYRVPVGGNTRTTSVNGGAGLFGLWPQPQYRTNCLPPVDFAPRATLTTMTTAAPASTGFFAAPQPAYRDCSKKTLVQLDPQATDGGKPSKATNKPAK